MEKTPNTGSSGQRLRRRWYAPGLRGVQLLAKRSVYPCRCPLSQAVGRLCVQIVNEVERPVEMRDCVAFILIEGNEILAEKPYAEGFDILRIVAEFSPPK